MPFDEYSRQLSRLLPFGTQSPYAFEEAETYYLKTDVAQLGQAGVDLAGTQWRSLDRYTIDNSPTAKDPYTLGQPPPTLVYREGHFEEFLQLFNERRGLAADGSLPPHTQSALDELRSAAASGAGRDALAVLASAVPWYHNLSMTYEGITLLRDESTACGQGAQQDDTWLCAAMPVSHMICGHPGTIQWTSPAFFVREDQPYFRVAVSRSGGGLGRVTVRYGIRHLTSDASDVTPTAPYTASQTLVFEEGIVMLSFIITINDDQEVEANEEFSLFLSNPTSGASIGAQGSTKVIIEDDDGPRLQAHQTIITGPSLSRPQLPGLAVGQPDPALPDTVATTVAGLPVILHMDIRNTSNQIPQDGTASWTWAEGGVDFPGEMVAEHRWLVEAWDLESQLSTQQYSQAPRDMAAQAASNWNPKLDAMGAAAPSAVPQRRSTVTRGFAVYGPNLARLLQSSAALPNGALAGVDFGALYDLSVPTSSGWGEMDVRGRYVAVTVPHVAGAQRTSVMHCKVGGLLGEYFTNANLNGEPAVTRVDYGVNFTFADGEIAGRASDFASVRWEGAFILGGGSELDALLDTAAGHGEVLVNFAMQSEAQDQVRLWVNHQLLFDTWGGRSTAKVPSGGAMGTVRVQLHSTNRIRLEWRHMTGDAQARLLWSYNTTGVHSTAAVPSTVSEFVAVPGSSLFSLRQAGFSPLATQVYPAGPSSGAVTGFGSTLSGSHLRSAVAGLPGLFYITSRDRFGNTRGQASAADTYEIDLVLMQPLYAMVDAASAGVLLDRDIFAPSSVGNQSPSTAVITSRVTYRSDVKLHEAAFQVSAAGIWQVRVFLVDGTTNQREELRESPVQVTVHNSVPVAETSPVVGRGLLSGEAGLGMPVAVRLRDRFNNLVLGGGMAARGELKLVATHSSAPAVWGDFVEWYASDYMGEWVPQRSGEYSVHVMLGREELPGSPFGPAIVIPTNTSSSTSFASGQGLNTMIATQNNSFLVHVRDRFGNVRHSGSGARFVGKDTVTARIESTGWTELAVTQASSAPEATRVQLLANGNVSVSELDMRHLGDDLYEVILHPFKAGTHTIHAELNGEVLGGSPFQVFITPGQVVAAACVVFVNESARSGIAGERVSFQVQVRDGAGNDQYISNDSSIISSSTTLQLRLPGDAGAPASWVQLQGAVSSVADGLFEVSYTPLLAGTYVFDALVSGTPVKNGTISGMSVAHSEINSSTAVIVGSQTTTGAVCDTPLMAGQEQTLFILARDSFGNDATRGGDAVVMQNTWSYVNGSGARVDGSPARQGPKDVAVLPAGGANYTAHYTPTLAGRYRTEMLLASRGMWVRTVFGDAGFVGGAVSSHTVPHRALSWVWPGSSPSFTANKGGDLRWSARWTAALRANTTGVHTLVLSSTDEASLSVSTGRPTANALRLSSRHVQRSVVINASAVSEDTRGNITSTGDVRTAFLTMNLQAGQFYHLVLQYSTDTAVRSRQSLDLRIGLPGSGVEAWRPRMHLQDTPPSFDDRVLALPHLPADMLIAIDKAQLVLGSAHSPLVLPAPVHAASCLAVGSGLSHATVDQDASFTVKLSDQFGNLQLGDAGASVTAVLRWVAPLTGSGTQAQLSQLERTVHAQVQYAGDAHFTITYRPSRIGEYSLSVAVNAEQVPRFAEARLQMAANAGHEVLGSPFAVKVVNSAPTALQSSAYGAALMSNRAGIPGRFFVQTRDTAGNNLTQPTAGGVSAYLLHENSATKTHAAVEYVTEGLYRVEYRTGLAGRHAVHVSVSGSPVADSPFALSVSHTLAHALTSTAEGMVPFNRSAEYAAEGGRRWAVGAPERFEITLRDAFGNLARDGHSELFVRVTPPAEPRVTVLGLRLPYEQDGSTRSTAQRSLDTVGKYEVYFTLPLAGRYKVRALLVSGSSGQHGLLAEYWDNAFMLGAPLRVRVEASPCTLWSAAAAAGLGGSSNQTAAALLAAIHLATPTQQQLDEAAGDPDMLPPGVPLPESNELLQQQLPGAVVGVASRSASVRWSGFVKAPATADYTLHVWANSGVHVFLDGQLEVEGMDGGGAFVVPLSKPLHAGQLYALRIEYKQLHGPAYFALAWSWRGQQGISSHGVRAIPPASLFPVGRPLGGSPFVLRAT